MIKLDKVFGDQRTRSAKMVDTTSPFTRSAEIVLKVNSTPGDDQTVNFRKRKVNKAEFGEVNHPSTNPAKRANHPADLKSASLEAH